MTLTTQFPNSIFFRLIIITLLSSCHGDKHELTNYVIDKTKGVGTKPITINLQPYTDIPKEQVTYVYQELSKIYPNIIVNNPIPLPKDAFYKPKNRYRADILLDHLSETTSEEHATIGMTSKDISTTKDEHLNWGVMGLGSESKKACVVSTFRLSKKNLLDQLFKVSIHELGHTQGLDHCPVKTCFMRDAKGGNPTNEETEFCPKCKAHLISRGWNFDKKPIPGESASKQNEELSVPKKNDVSEYFLCNLGTNTLSVRNKILSAKELVTANSTDEEAKGLLNDETQLGVMSDGQKLQILETTGNYLKIQTSIEGKMITGYIASKVSGKKVYCR